MTRHDTHGIALSTTRAEAVAAYDRALALFNGFRRDPLAVIGQALEQDPDFVAGHLLRAGLLLGSFDSLVVPMAGACLEAAAACGTQPNVRERSLLGALRTWVMQGLDAGNRALDRHLVDHPRDLFALQLAHLGDLMLGRTLMLRDRMARMDGIWHAGEPGHAYVMAMQAFGLEENADLAQAEALGLQALELQPHNTWAVHAVAHVHETSGRSDQGLRWLEGTRPRWRSDNILSVHLHWHLALCRLACEGAASALRLYDEAIAPTPESLAMNLSDATALLWRLHLRGVDGGARWAALADRWLQRAAWGRTAFTDLHAALSLAMAGSDAVNRDFTAALEAARFGRTAALPWDLVVRPAHQAFADYVAGDHGACADRLLGVLPVLQAVGGSHAQRELVLLTAASAAERGGDLALAQALERQRTALRRLAGRALRPDPWPVSSHELPSAAFA